MPKIQEYDAQVNPSLIVQSKPQQGSGIATGLQNIGKGLSDLGSGIDQYQQKQDRLSASAELSEAEREYLDEVNNLKTVPSEEQLNAIRERYDNRVNAISEKMQTSGGSDFLSSKSLAVKESITAHSNAKIAELTAVKNRNEIETLAKNKSIIVANNPTGENLVTGLADVRSRAFDLMGDKGTALADDLSKGIVMAHFKATLESPNNGPDVAKALVNNKLYDGTGINGEDKMKMLDMVDQYKDAQRREREHNLEMSLKYRKLAREKEQDNLFQKMYEGKLTSKDIMNSNLPAYGQGSKNTFIKALNAPNKESNKAVFNDLLTRIDLPESSPNKLIDQSEIIENRAKGRLSSADANFLLAQYKQQSQSLPEINTRKSMIKQAEVEAQRKLILPSFASTPEVNQQRIADFRVKLRTELSERLNKGEDFYKLMDPSDKDYLPGKILRTMEMSIKDAQKMKYETQKQGQVETKSFQGVDYVKVGPGRWIKKASYDKGIR